MHRDDALKPSVRQLIGLPQGFLLCENLDCTVLGRTSLLRPDEMEHISRMHSGTGSGYFTVQRYRSEFSYYSFINDGWIFFIYYSLSFRRYL